jgi:GTP-binding protein EngB required for normal cell division
MSASPETEFLPAGSLSARVDALAVRAQERSSGPASDAVAAVRSRLSEPLRVALVGRVSSGKSTLLNALLGRPLAATAAGECTQVPSWYRHGRWPRASALTTDGRTVAVMTAPGKPLTDLPLPVEQVRRVEVEEPAPALRKMTLIDTPGLAAAGSSASGRTNRLLEERSLASSESADALLFVVNGPLHGDERDAVETFTRAAADTAAGAVALAVLSKADKIGADPAAAWEQATSLAARMTSDHRALFAAVVPVVGLLAQTGTLGLPEPEARDLVALADAWDPGLAQLALADTELFCSLDAPVPGPRRRALLERVDLYGAARLLAAIREGRARNAHQLSDVASTASGLPSLVSLIETTLQGQADALKAHRALMGLHRAVQSPGAPAGLADALEELENSADLLAVRLFQVRALVTGGRVQLPDDLDREFIEACSPAGLPAVPAAEAARRAGEWTAWAMFVPEAGRRVAEVMVRAWHVAGGLA